jgi:CxC2 like cysteine cluster associated with KDZ transposases
MQEWIPQRDHFLSTILASEALPQDPTCSHCSIADGLLRCNDCFGGRILCQQCCLNLHKSHPFHVLQRWNGSFFAETSLHSEGFILHLGHDGDPCPTQSLSGVDDVFDDDPEDQWVYEEDEPLLGRWERFDRDVILVVDCGGVHQRHISWCQCADAPARHVQLLQHGLYPSSLHRPKTAFTFQVLNYFWIDAVECKTSAMNFFSKLRRLTNYSMPHRVPVSFLKLT